jgi:hypothetical protein
MKILYLLVCEHTDQGDLTNASKLTCYCHKCNANRSIIKVIKKEWYAVCYDCRFKRWYGLNKELAIRGARGHWRNKNHRTSHGERERPDALRAIKIMKGIGGPPKKRAGYSRGDHVRLACGHTCIAETVVSTIGRGTVFETVCPAHKTKQEILEKMEPIREVAQLKPTGTEDKPPF